MISEVKFFVPWGHIAAKAWGSPKGRPVLCLHGWLDNANTFNRLIPLLPKDCYYLAVDMGGHGLSSHRPPGFPYHFLDFVGDVYRVAEALKWSRFTLMGHSLGGTVAGMFSSIFPDMVDKLILVESLGFFPAPKGDQRGPRLNRQKQSSSPFTPKDAPSKLEEYEKLLAPKRKLFEDLLSFEANKQYSPKVRSPEEALRRLLEANSDLTEDSGKILLQRGTTEVPGGVVYNRDLRVTLVLTDDEIVTYKTIWPEILNVHICEGRPKFSICFMLHNHSFVSLDQTLIFLKKIQADVLMILAQEGIFSTRVEETAGTKTLPEAFKASLKERFQRVDVPGNHFVHLNEPKVMAGIIHTFLSKGNNLKASL